MTRHEKLILLVVSLLVVTRLGVVAREIYIANHYGAAGLSLSDKANWKAISAVWEGLVNVGAAIWLVVEARAASLRAWVWALFGLFFGLLGVVLFYLVQVYTRNRAAET
jgi:hypothetical protein